MASKQMDSESKLGAKVQHLTSKLNELNELNDLSEPYEPNELCWVH